MLTNASNSTSTLESSKDTDKPEVKPFTQTAFKPLQTPTPHVHQAPRSSQVQQQQHVASTMWQQLHVTAPLAKGLCHPVCTTQLPSDEATVLALQHYQVLHAVPLGFWPRANKSYMYRQPYRHTASQEGHMGCRRRPFQPSDSWSLTACATCHIAYSPGRR